MAITPSEKDQRRFDGDVPELLNVPLQPGARDNKTIVSETVVGVTAKSGATRPGGKSDEVTQTLRSGSLPAAEAVRTVDRDANKDIRKKAQQQQEGPGDGNPKRRTRSVWGQPTEHAKE
jgi:hypothetical protein